jgi:glucokinase
VRSALGVDIGGTKLAAGLVDDRGTITSRVETATPATADSEELWSTLADLLDSLPLSDRRRAAVVGVGCGGPMTPGGELVSPLNIPAWRAFPLRDRLANHTRLDVHIDNDAKALALGEGWIGAAKGEPNFIAMVVSTGVGGGIVVDGRLLDGATGNAGHIGHVIVEPGGRLCGCGARGCLEAEASGIAIRAITGRAPAEASRDVVEHTGTLVGRAVGSVVNLLDLRLAVVAGSVALGFGEPFFTAAQAELDCVSRLEFSRGARIVAAGLGRDGPLVGAAAVALVATAQ